MSLCRDVTYHHYAINGDGVCCACAHYYIALRTSPATQAQLALERSIRAHADWKTPITLGSKTKPTNSGVAAVPHT